MEIAGRSAFEQVVHFLIHETEERGDPTVEMTQSELAETLGVGRQTVSRVLRQLAQLGLFTARRGRIDVLDPQRLTNHVPA